jgi:BioD-like phosphotransacetylase family protein
VIQTQTFEFNKATKDEIVVIARALQLIGEKRYDEAAKVLIERHDELTREPELKLYVQR